MNHRHLLIFFFIVICSASIAQNSLLLNFPTIDSTGTSINAKSVLAELKWNELKAFCDSMDGQYARERGNELIKTYSYTKQGAVANFKLVVFDGKVLEYRSEVDQRADVNQVFKTNYFDRELWLKYLHTDSTFRKSKWNIPSKDWIYYPDEVIQAYYTLLGFNTRDEYGWICEYSAAGFPPPKRKAIVDLINYQRRDFILRLLDHPNTQTKLYAADALIYLDMIDEIQSIDMLNHKGNRRSKRYVLKYSPNYKLSSSKWEKIFKIRDANLKVITCGNMGSYKQYSSDTKILLSDKMMDEIYQRYAHLKRLGYLVR